MMIEVPGEETIGGTMIVLPPLHLHLSALPFRTAYPQDQELRELEMLHLRRRQGLCPLRRRRHYHRLLTTPLTLRRLTRPKVRPTLKPLCNQLPTSLAPSYHP